MQIYRNSLVFALSILTLCFAGCSSEHFSNQDGAGRIIPEVVVNHKVTSASNPDEIIDIGGVPVSGDFTIKITSKDGNYSGTWKSLSSYFPAQAVLSGSYSVEASYGSIFVEGFDTPYFYGYANCDLEDGEEQKVHLECRLSNALVAVNFSEEAQEYFPELAVGLHSIGGGYVIYPKGETRYAYLRPGKIYVSVQLKMPDGKECSFMVTDTDETDAGELLTINVSLERSEADAPVLCVGVGNENIKMAITPEFIDSPSPVISCVGFISDQPLNLKEGQTPKSPLKMIVPVTNVSSLILTTIAPSLVQQGWSQDIDILKTDKLSSLTALGVKIEKGDYITIDFTDLIPHLRDTDGLPDRFNLQAISDNGKVSIPVSLMVELISADISLLSVSSPVVGVDEASFKVYCDTDPVNTLSLTMLENNQWIPLPFTAIKPVQNSANVYMLDFKVPAGTSSIPLRLMYNNVVKVETMLRRLSPEYDIEVDAFALKAVVRFKPKDESMLKTIISLAKVYAGNSPLIQIARDEEKGEIIVSGLKEKTSYKFKATVMSNPTALDFTPEVAVTTEAASSLPNGDFEEIIEKYTTYSKMPSGGKYSQNIVEIFNLQNYSDVKFTVPEVWANVNAKTYNLQVKNVNTWYVTPSVRTLEISDAYAGSSFAVRIDNVAFDPDGPEIPDYLQEREPYVKYSRNIPKIRYKSVGKIFLGSYKWDSNTLIEEYNEGITFSSRPAALNGFYRFVPAVPGSSQHGYVKVELIGDNDKVISSGEGHLTPAMSYTAFSVPLEYKYFGEKAKKLKVMVAASPEIGSIAHETQMVVTVDDPVTATSIGSSLWVDQLAFSY